METLAKRIDAKRIELGLSKTDIWKKAGLSSGAYSHWMNGGELKGDNLLRVAQILKVNPTWLQTGKGDMNISVRPSSREVDINSNSEFVAIKRADFKLSAGITGFIVEFLNGERAPIIFRKDWLSSRGFIANNLYAVSVNGQSMESNLYDGDLVVINTADTKPIDGDVFALNYEGELVIKRMKREGGEWFISSDNSDKRRYPDKRCHEDCFIIGRIVHKQTERI